MSQIPSRGTAGNSQDAAGSTLRQSHVIQQHFPQLYAFWKFSRPHTIIGTSLSIIGLYLMAFSLGLQTSPFTLLPTLLACLCGNIYIVGLNQLEDVAIDRINKPHLPLASGEFTRAQGQWIVRVTGFLALAIAATQGVYLLGMVAISLAIGTAYSLPPVRLKRFPFWASVCIFSVRGAIVNLGLFLHYANQGQDSWQQVVSNRWELPLIPPAVWVLTAFILVFTFAIAIFKDIPDLEGDRQYNISTLTIRLGSKAVFNLARWVLTLCYGGMMFAAALQLPGVNVPFLLLTHGLILGGLWWRTNRVDLQDKQAIARCYQFIWKLFFLEYLLFPVACLLTLI